ncbi:class I tRNA ligase family protein [bacterium]|nr:class I tRNA ligase family protein [bacterium]
MKILNSVDNKKYELSEKTIAIYNCGPTVYNYVHIGNVRPLIIFDVLYRYLLKNNKKVAFYHNITDIDDKIINAAKQNNTTEQKISQKYTQAYLDLFSILNIKKMEMPKVSDHIQDIITYIQNLINAGFAYVVGNDVYFDVMKIPNYGKISHQNIKNLLNGVRKDNSENKRHPLDFVLWKATNEGLS